MAFPSRVHLLTYAKLIRLVLVKARLLDFFTKQLTLLLYSRKTDIPRCVDMVERSQKSEQMCDACADNQTMHDLVARTPNIVLIGVPLLGNLATTDISKFLWKM
jgi:hypothetical protein